jgi:GrpB-like predicted nucleotidyltransferase (UPF0157 family)
MTVEPPFKLVEPQKARRQAQRLFTEIHALLKKMLPTTAEIRHVGATRIPNCLTKGDLDIVVRVPANDFICADLSLAKKFDRNNGSVRTDEFSAFEDGSLQPHLGIQLVAIDGPYDFFHLFSEALLKSPNLVNEYNQLKSTHDGTSMAVYRKAKDAFIDRVLLSVSNSAITQSNEP